MRGKIVGGILVAVALAAAPPAAGASKPPTLKEAQRVATAAAAQPGVYGAGTVAEGAGPWRTRPGFCNRQWWARRVVNCWVNVDFVDWPGCWIADLWRVRRVHGRLDAKQLNRYTTGSTTCPGFGTFGVESAG